MKSDQSKIPEGEISQEQARDLLGATKIIGEVIAAANGLLIEKGSRFRVDEVSFHNLDKGDPGMDFQKEKYWVCHCTKGENNSHGEVCIYVGPM